MITQRLSACRLVDLLGNWQGGGHSYLELGESIEILVRDGAIAAGAVLPAERPFAEALRVSRTTVAAAYQRLRESGIAVSRQGSGTVIRHPRRPVAGDGGDRGTAEVIDFSQACLAPWHGMETLGARALTEKPETFRRHGFDTLGNLELRRGIADRYSARGLPTSPEQIMVTLGAQHAIFLIARTLLGRGDRSLIETPSYPYAREALAAAGALIAEMPVGVGSREEAGTLEIARRVSPRLAYLIPDHHNPTGLSMPHEFRARLIDELSAQGSLVIADETTAELSLGEARRVLPFAASAEHAFQRDTILTVGSLGKTVWGGLRVGWIRAAPEIITRLEVSRRVGDLGTGEWQQVMAILALECYDEILADRTRELTARHRTLVEQLRAELPAWHPSPAEGGVCTWVDLGEHRSSTLARESARLGLKLVPGPRFGSPGVFERFVRLPFTATEPELVRAVQVLGEAWRASPVARSEPQREDAVI